VRHATVRLGLRLVGAIALTGIVTAASVRTSVDYLERRVDRIERAPENLARELLPVPDDPEDPVTYLLVGSDCRDCLAPGQEESFGSAEQEVGQRADAILLVRVDPSARRSFILSIPRDTWVELPDGREGRINAAYDGADGITHLVDTITRTFGVTPNHTVEIDFDDVRRVVDEIGGVNLYFDKPMRDRVSSFDVFDPATFEAGVYLLNGDQSLAFVRSRHTEIYEHGRWEDNGRDAPDLHRAERQQYFLRELARAVINRGLDDPGEVDSMLDLADDGGVVLSGDVDLEQVVRLMRVMRGVDPSDQDTIETATLPVDPFTAPGGAAALRWRPDDPDTLAYLAAIRGDRTSSEDVQPADVRLALSDLSTDGSGDALAFALGASGFPAPRRVDGDDLGPLADPPVFRPAQEGTEIRYAPHRRYEAERVQSVLGDDVPLVRDERLRDELPGVEVLVIVRAAGETPDVAGATEPAD
jgi:LCP family protein required for cell wall assembly